MAQTNRSIALYVFSVDVAMGLIQINIAFPSAYPDVTMLGWPPPAGF